MRAAIAHTTLHGPTPDWNGFVRGRRLPPLLTPRVKMYFSGRDAWRCSRHQGAPPAGRVLEYPAFPLCDLWNCSTFRYGEARHPGPPQRIVS
eukprot:6469429-Amphidinium_carterae.1